MTQSSQPGAPKPRPGKLVTAGLLASLLALLAAALVTTAGAQGPRRNTPLIQDWSHRHVIFPNNPNRPMTLGGPVDPRVWLAWLQRNAPAFQVSAPSPAPPPVSLFPNRPVKKGFKTDWAVSLGSTSAGNGVAQNMYPAKFSFDATAPPSCLDDFAIFPINSTPSATQANIVAFNYLYRGPGNTGICSPGTAPNTMWAYKVGSGPVKTSPALYWDSNLTNSGLAVAFVESRTNPNASVFHIVPAKGASGGSIGSPITPASDRYVQYSSATNTRSSPFIDYANDVAYVGADDGVLYKIGPVFKSVANPTVIHQTTVSSGKKLTAPVHDPASDRVFVSDGLLVYAYQPTDTGFVFMASIQIAYPNTPAHILDPVIVDSGTWVYVFSGGNNNEAGTRKAVVVQTKTDLTSPVSAEIGVYQTESGYSIHAGGFDDAYYTNPSTGKLYVCGNAGGGHQGVSTLYKFGFLSPSGTMNTTAEVMKDVSDAASGGCSPLTTFNNSTLNPPERLFFGQTNANGTKSNHVQMWYLPVNSGDSRVAGDTGGTYAGGTSGIIVDNARSEAQASSIYFGTLQALAACGSRVCAVKLTQSALQ